MQIKRELLNDQIEKELIKLSILWEQEASTYGYIRNNHEVFVNQIIFLCYDKDKVIGYAYGNYYDASRDHEIIRKDQKCFEIEEIYILKEYRNQGIGTKLFKFIEDQLKKEDIDFITLSTADKDYKKIFHFYLDMLDMTFWSARLFKKLK